MADSNYQTEVDNLGIPPLAGLCSYEEAARDGLSVDQTVTLLRRYNYVLRRLNELAAAHLPSTPEWEVKCALGLHLWIDAEHCAALRTRVAEMREPPLRLDEVPDPRLEAMLEELLRAANTIELLAGVYGTVRPALRVAVQSHLEQCNPLFDYPTVRVLGTILREQEEILGWGATALEAVTQSRRCLPSRCVPRARGGVHRGGGRNRRGSDRSQRGSVADSALGRLSR